MLKQKKTNTIHFVSIPELDDALDEMKRQNILTHLILR